MADTYLNDSYNRCMAELRARYNGRGVSVNAKRSAAEQIANESANMLAARSDSFVSFDPASGILDEYRSGEYKGSKYMTSDDFVRYFRNRNTYNMPVALRNAQKSMEAKAGQQRAVAARRGAGRESLVASDGTSKEGHLKTRIETFVTKWFPIEPREGRSEGSKFRIPTRAVGSMAAFALSLGLIVGGSVMIGNASSEVGSLNSKISHLEAQQTELQSQLDLKYNIQDIEEEAKSLGMINKEYAQKSYLEVGEEEEIEIYEQEETNVGFAALLNAFGIDID
ncbi:MAG: hypothetical protein J6A83_07645 [Clostridia bacterium]|nr:hypothetical protein [Clostridia bacterium]